jgi:hypothetical protein
MLHSEELHNLYSNPNIIKQIKSNTRMWAEHDTHEKKVYKALAGNLNGKRPLGKPRRRWEEWILGGVDLAGSRWGEVVVSCEHGDTPSRSGAM